MRRLAAITAFVLTSIAASAAADPPISDELIALDARVSRSPHDVEARVLRAEALLRAGDPERALLDVEAGEALTSDGRLVLLRAACLVALERDEEALDTLDDGALSRMRAPFAALTLRASILLRRRELRAAIGDLDRALAWVADPDLFLLRARASVALGDETSALDGLAEGIALTGSAVLEEALIAELIRTDRTSEALALIDRSSGSLPELRRILLQSRLLLQLGRLEEARDAANAALHLAEARARTRPSAAHHLELASALALVGRCDEARAQYLAAEALSPAYAHGEIAGLGRVEATLEACTESAR